MALNYSYEHLGYRINVSNNNFSIYEPFFKGLKLMEYYKETNAKELFNNEAGLYHELSHYYQDIVFPACICERDLKIKILTNSNSTISEKLQGLYKYLFKEGQSMEMLQSISDPNSGIDFWTISFKDLLESYADIRSIKTILDAYFKKNEDVDSFVSKCIIEQSSFHYEFFDGKKVLARLRETTRPYAICKQVFLTMISLRKSKFLFNDEEPTADLMKINMADGYSHSKNSFIYVLERRLDIFLLFCIEFALTIPSVSFIMKAVEEGKSIRMFHPGCRFYYIIHLICENPDTFNKLDFNANYVEVFDIISERYGLYSYDEVVGSYVTPDRPFSTIKFFQNKILKETKKVTIGNRCNSDIMGFFMQTGVPILLWGQGRQQIYIGNGNNGFDSYCYEGETYDYVVHYMMCALDRFFLRKTNDTDDLKQIINGFLLQESAVYYALNKCANTIINDNRTVVCPLSCKFKNDNCLLYTIFTKSEEHQPCVLKEIIKSNIV